MERSYAEAEEPPRQRALDDSPDARVVAPLVPRVVDRAGCHHRDAELGVLRERVGVAVALPAPTGNYDANRAHPEGALKAVIQYDPKTIPSNDNFKTVVMFDGTQSVGHGTFTYKWDLGTGKLVGGSLTDGIVRASFAGTGPAPVALTVSDDTGAMNSTAAIVRIATAPSVVLGGDMTTEVAKPVVLDASLSFDRGGMPLGFAWTAGSTTMGTAPPMISSASTAKASFTATDPGDYPVNVKVTAGNLAATGGLIVHVLPALKDQTPLAATVTVSPAVAAKGTPVTFTVNVTPALALLAVELHVGDDVQTFTGTTFTKTYPVGFYPVVATVRSKGRTGRARATLGVYDPAIGDNGPPTVSLATPAEMDVVNKTVPATGTASDTDFGRWFIEARLTDAPSTGDWTLLSTGTNPVTNGPIGSVDTSLINPGGYDIRLRAVDTRGNSATDQHSVIVAGTAPMGNIQFGIEDVGAPRPAPRSSSAAPTTRSSARSSATSAGGRPRTRPARGRSRRARRRETAGPGRATACSGSA